MMCHGSVLRGGFPLFGVFVCGFGWLSRGAKRAWGQRYRAAGGNATRHATGPNGTAKRNNVISFHFLSGLQAGADDAKSNS
eukprot:3701652-Rhodomonas_salina.1